MSTQPSSNVNQKQPLSVYTVMLIISTLALLIACILLAMELKEYGDFPYWNTREATPSVSWIAPESPQHLA